MSAQKSVGVSENGSIIPERWKILNGSVLKLLAVITMILDHTASLLMEDTYYVVLRFGERTVDLYEIMRLIGRISFPLYAFLLMEGFEHTRNVKRYAGNLLIFALLSEIPWDLAHSGRLLCSGQNVMFTLLFGLLGMWVIRDMQGSIQKKAPLMIGLLALSVVFRADFGCSGFGFILMLYLLRSRKFCQAVVGSCMLPARWTAGTAFLFIGLYNGKRGFIRGLPFKNLFYFIYPVHLLVLYWIRKKTIGF